MKNFYKYIRFNIILTVFFIIFNCSGDTIPGPPPSEVTGTYHELTTTENYDFVGNIQTLNAEILAANNGTEFTPTSTKITGIVTTKSNWQYDYNGDTYKGSFFIQDKNAGIMVLHDSDSDGLVQAGEKVSLTVTTVVYKNEQPLVLAFNVESIVILAGPTSIYVQDVNSIDLNSNNLSNAYIIEGVVQSVPGVLDSFEPSVVDDYRAIIKTDAGISHNFQLGIDLVRGSQDGFNFQVLGKGKFNLQSGQRVKVWGPVYTNGAIIAIALENIDQIEILEPVHTNEVSNFLAVYDQSLNAIKISWDNPAGISGVLIKRKTSGFSSDPWDKTDGLTIFSGTSQLAYDYQVNEGISYNYTAFSFDDTPDYSEGKSKAFAKISGSAAANLSPNGCDVYINEVGADANRNDFNGDDDTHFGDDEFIEIYNKNCGAIDFSGWSIKIKNTVQENIKHIFEDGTILPNNSTIIVFGGQFAEPVSGNSFLGGSQFATVNQVDALDIFSSGALISLFDAEGKLLDEVDASGKKNIFGDPIDGNFCSNGTDEALRSFNCDFAMVRTDDSVTDIFSTLWQRAADVNGLDGSPGLLDGGNLISGNTSLYIIYNASIPKPGDSISNGTISDIKFNLPLQSSSVTSRVELFQNVNCSDSATIITTLSVQNNIISIAASLTGNADYCILLQTGISSDLAQIQFDTSETSSLNSDIKYLFNTN